MSASEPASDGVRGRSPRGEVSETGTPDDVLGFRHPEVQRLRRLLGRRSARVDEGAFVVEGPGLLAEAIAGGWDVETVYVDERAEPALVPSGNDVRHLGRGVLERVATTENPQPVLAVVRLRDDRRLPPDAALVLVADGVNDPGNLGTMFRSAEAAGFDAVVTTPGTVDTYNPKVLRASAGAIFHVRVVVATLDEVRASGLRLVGTSSHTGTDHTGFDWSPPLAIVVGSEAHGLADDAPVDDWVRVTHSGRTESLNVAMAATLLCFEAARHRDT